MFVAIKKKCPYISGGCSTTPRNQSASEYLRRTPSPSKYKLRDSSPHIKTLKTLIKIAIRSKHTNLCDII